VKRRDPHHETPAEQAVQRGPHERRAGVRLHDFNCGFKLYRREVVDALEVYGELHRFLPALGDWRGSASARWA
jgi:hypothetical protein